MKKIILSALLFVMLISMNYENSNAQCLPGGTLYTFSYNIGDCHYVVSYCEYYDPISNTYAIDIVKVTFDWSGFAPCGGISINPTFMNDAKDRAVNDFFLNHTDPMSVSIPPCPSQSTFLLDFKAISCWYASLYTENGNSKIRIEPCTTSGAIAFCQVKYTICRNMSTGKIERTQVSSTYSTGYACSEGFPDLGTFVNSVSPCFSFGCW